NVANGQQFGYNFKIAPRAGFTDGLLDVTIFRKFPKLLGGAPALRAMYGDNTGRPHAQHYQAKEVTITHPHLKLMQTDGDPHSCGTRLDFRVAPGALMVLLP